MLQKILAGLSISFLSISAASAFNHIEIPNGKGSLYKNNIVNMNLDSLGAQNIYNFRCTIQNNGTDTTPTILRVDLTGTAPGKTPIIWLDNARELTTHQAWIEDNKAHAIDIYDVQFWQGPMSPTPTLTLSRLDGADANNLSFYCFAEYAANLKH